MTSPTPAEQLRAAAQMLDDDAPAPGTSRIVTSERLQSEIVAICDRHDDPTNPPAHLDANGCCGDCEFVVTYSPALAHQLAALINARAPIAAWLKSWDGINVSEHGPHPDDWRAALDIARAINGEVTG